MSYSNHRSLPYDQYPNGSPDLGRGWTQEPKVCRLSAGGNGIRTFGPPVPGGRLERTSALRTAMGAVRMRNAKPAAKKSRLYDHALTAISGARSYSTGSVKARER